MERRTFLNQAALVGMGLPVWHLSGFKRANGPSEAWLTALIQDNDLQVDTLLRRQSLDASSVNYGGIPDAYDLYHAGSAAGFIQRLTCSYINLESRYYKSSLLLDRMLRAAGFLRQVQHDDGSIDLLTTNFHSPPDTAFVVEPMAISMGLLQDLAGETDALLLELRKFLQKAGDILTVGGIHTPNHRWVVSMALALPTLRQRLNLGQPTSVSGIMTGLAKAEGVEVITVDTTQVEGVTRVVARISAPAGQINSKIVDAWSRELAARQGSPVDLTVEIVPLIEIQSSSQ